MGTGFSRWISALGLAGLLAGGTTGAGAALVLGADFSAQYTVGDLGSVTGLPSPYGGLTFLAQNTLLIGGNANDATGRLFTVELVRDATGHVTGFAGAATPFGTAIGEWNDGGVVFGPAGVLFTARWPENELGQTRPGSTDEDKIIDLALLGVAESHAALGFVPAGFAGAGSVKLVSWEGGEFYSASYVPDGAGTFDLVGLARIDLDSSTLAIDNLPGGPEGFVFIPGTNAGFDGVDSMLVSDFSAGRVSAYRLDANGNPMVSTRRDFLTGLTGAEGAVIDPWTGDFLFSTFGGADQVVAVRGFARPDVTCGVPGTPPCPTPEPGTLPLVGTVALAAGAWALRGRRQRRP